MKTVTLYSGTALPAFNVSPSDPNYWLCHEAFEIVSLLKRCADAGVELTQAEQSDYEAAQTAFSDLSSTLQVWLSDAVSASEAGQTIPALDDDYIPELIQFLALALTGQWGAVFVLFVKVGLDFLVRWFKKRLEPGNTRFDMAETLDSALLVRDSEGTVVGSKLESLGNISVTINGDDAIGCVWVEALIP